MRKWLRDWWRGYSDADIANLRKKLGGPHRTGGIIPLSNSEFNALKANGWVW